MQLRYLLIALPFFFKLVACRNDEGSELLSWSCVEKAHGTPKATPECYKKLLETSDPVLKYYSASPISKNGRIEYYTLAEKQVSR